MGPNSLPRWGRLLGQVRLPILMIVVVFLALSGRDILFGGRDFPLADSKGKNYCFYLEAPSLTEEEATLVRYEIAGEHFPGTMVLDRGGTSAYGDLAFQTYYRST